MKLLVAFTLAILTCLMPVAAALSGYYDDPAGLCQTAGSCVCHYDNNYKIDLNPLQTSATPVFAGVVDDEASTLSYSYSPCSDFTTSSCPTSNAICQVNATSGNGISCGSTQGSYFTADADIPSEVVLVYPNGAVVNGQQLTTHVILTCDPSADPGNISVTFDSGDYTVFLNLNSKYCCPVNFTASAYSHGSSISPGTIICISFVVLLAIYFVAGTLFLKFGKGAKGRELVPNFALWASLPGLIKDGILFTVSCLPCGKKFSSVKYDHI